MDLTRGREPQVTRARDRHNPGATLDARAVTGGLEVGAVPALHLEIAANALDFNELFGRDGYGLNAHGSLLLAAQAAHRILGRDLAAIQLLEDRPAGLFADLGRLLLAGFIAHGPDDL